MSWSDDSFPRDGETLDTILNGRIKLMQPEKGYRFSMDSVLLTGLTRTSPQDGVMDLGTGCGVIPLLLAVQHQVAHVTGIEIQETLASIARRNVSLNGLSHLVRIICGDLRAMPKGVVGSPITLVVSNPPYRELRSGRLNPDKEKAVARHEVLANLTDVVRAASRLLVHRGRLALIYPARRLPHLLSEVSQGGFAPRQLTLIHTNLETPAKLAHLESVKGGGEELQVSKPFAVYQMDGSYTAEMAAMYGDASAVS